MNKMNKIDEQLEKLESIYEKIESQRRKKQQHDLIVSALFLTILFLTMSIIYLIN